MSYHEPERRHFLSVLTAYAAVPTLLATAVGITSCWPEDKTAPPTDAQLTANARHFIASYALFRFGKPMPEKEKLDFTFESFEILDLILKIVRSNTYVEALQDGQIRLETKNIMGFRNPYFFILGAGSYFGETLRMISNENFKWVRHGYLKENALVDAEILGSREDMLNRYALNSAYGGGFFSMRKIFTLMTKEEDENIVNFSRGILDDQSQKRAIRQAHSLRTTNG